MAQLDGDLGLVFPDGNSQQFPATPVRQTVLSGPVDSAGLSAFGGSTGGLTVAATGTIWFHASNGLSGRVAKMINPSWTIPSANGVYQLFADAGTNQVGTAVTGALNLLTNYQMGGAYSTSPGQATFNIQEMVMKVGNGTTADQAYRVPVGEVTVSGGVVTSIVWYTLMRRIYVENASVPANGTPVVLTHNAGIPPQFLTWMFGARCVTADSNLGTAVGDFIPITVTDNGVSAASAQYHARLASVINGYYNSIAPAKKTDGTRGGFVSGANYKLGVLVGSNW